MSTRARERELKHVKEAADVLGVHVEAERKP
jgi:hypothetical protein